MSVRAHAPNHLLPLSLCHVCNCSSSWICFLDSSVLRSDSGKNVRNKFYMSTCLINELTRLHRRSNTLICFYQVKNTPLFTPAAHVYQLLFPSSPVTLFHSLLLSLLLIKALSRLMPRSLSRFSVYFCAHKDFFSCLTAPVSLPLLRCRILWPLQSLLLNRQISGCKCFCSLLTSYRALSQLSGRERERKRVSQHQ